jgi:sugar lactone lactonase YvrE
MKGEAEKVLGIILALMSLGILTTKVLSQPSDLPEKRRSLMLPRLGVSNQRQTATKRMVFCGGWVVLAFFVLISVTSLRAQTVPTINTVAGGGPNNLPALNVGLNGPTSVAFDANGNYYIASPSQNRVFKVDTTGTLTVFAGTGSGPAYGGNGSVAGPGDGGPATSANLNSPNGVAVDAAGNVYIAEAGNHRIRKVDSTGTITTIAGNGTPGYGGDGGPATSANLNSPSGVAVDLAGNIYIADSVNNRIRVVDSTGGITTFAGNGAFCGPNGPNACGDGRSPALASLANPMGVAVGPNGEVFIADSLGNRIRAVPPGQAITTVAGAGSPLCPNGPPCTDPVSGFDASLNMPQGVTVIADMHTIGIADTANSRIETLALSPLSLSPLQILAVTGDCTTEPGNTPCVQAVIGPLVLAPAPGGGSLYIADSAYNRIDATATLLGGAITTVAGNGTPSFAGDGGLATLAEFSVLASVAVDPAGNIYIADRDNGVVRKVDVTGVVTTVAGNAAGACMGGDGIPATSACLSQPNDLALDPAGDLYIIERSGGKVVRVDAATGTISTVAGGGTGCIGAPCYAIDAAFTPPTNGVALDSNGNVYIASPGDNRIFKADTNGIITTVAGTGAQGYGGDYGLATEAALNQPNGVRVDAQGNLYIADTFNQRVRKVDATTGVITTVAGNGVQGYSGDSGPAVNAALNNPQNATPDNAGNLYIADSANSSIRKVDAFGIITTLAGDGVQGFGGDGGPPTLAMLTWPNAVAVDSASGLLIADMCNHRIRSIGNTPAGSDVVVPPVDTSTGATPVTVTFSTVTRPGNTSLTTSTAPSGSTAGTPQTYYNLITSAVSTGSIQVCINYNGVWYGNSDEIFIWQYDPSAGAWNELATTVDTTNTTACASTPFLSLFAFSPGLSVSLSAKTLAFGNQPLSTTSAAQTETVTNTGAANVTISTVTVGGANASDFATSADNCTGATLLPAGTCTVNVTFNPTATGARSAWITITDNASGSPQTVILTGTGNGPVAGVSPPSLTFGNLNLGTTSGSQPVTLSNTGPATLTITSIVTSANFGETDNCAGSVAAGGSCTINVTFSPAVIGLLTGTLSITDNSNGVTGSQQTVSLTGTGNGPVPGVSPPSLTFGNQPLGTTSGSQPVTLSNTGTTALTITSIVTSPNFGQTNTCAGSVAAGGSCTINVTFSPTATGLLPGTLTITDIVPASPQVIPLIGTGVSPVVTSSGDLSFGATLVGEASSSQAVTLTNNGNSAVTITGISTSSGFLEKDNCGTLLAVGGSCTITVTSDPTSPGSTSGTLTINDSDPASPHTIALQGIGLAPGVAAIFTMAGGGPNYLPAPSVGLNGPTSVAFDAKGNYYIAAQNQRRVFKVDTSGTLTVFAGNGSACSLTNFPCGDGQAATNATFSTPWGVAVDGVGNVYISDAGVNRIRMVDTTGTIRTFAGNGTFGYNGDGIPATSARLSNPHGVAVDQAGNVYIADSSNQRIRMVDTSGTIWTFAGNGSGCGPNGPNSCGDWGPATSASLANPYGVAVDPSGNVYIADTGANRIRLVFPGQYGGTLWIFTVAGVGSPLCPTGPPCSTPNGWDASLAGPQGVASLGWGQIGIADTGHNRVVMAALINPITEVFMMLLGGNGRPAYSGDGGPSQLASLNNPTGLGVNPATGSLYVADTVNNRIRTWGANVGTISTAAGNGTPAWAGDGGMATLASFSAGGVVKDPAGNIYIGDAADHCVRQVNAATGIISTVVGNPMAPGYGGDGGPAAQASLQSPGHLALDGAGNLYIADAGNGTVRRVDATTGYITTVAGNGARCQERAPSGLGTVLCYAGDGGLATYATLAEPSGVALDGAGNVYIADEGVSLILRVDAVTGNITTVAGNGTECYQYINSPSVPAPLNNTCYSGPGGKATSGDGGPATSATLYMPAGLALDGAGNLYFADLGNNRIREVNTTGTPPLINTVAGNGIPCNSNSGNPPCYIGDNGSATLASLSNPNGVAVDGAGNLYIADPGNARVRRVNAGTITTVAGNGIIGFSGDGGSPTLASVWPSGVAVDPAGGLLISDASGRIRSVGNTPTGSNIAIPPVDTTTGTSPVTLTFPSITQPGNTSLTTSNTGPTPPSGFVLGTTPPTYYNLTTSAVYTGSITVCINYSGVYNGDPSLLTIGHYDTTTDTWDELATTINTTNTTACASTPSLSPFALLVASPPLVTLSATSLAFGPQNVGTTSAPQTATVTNTGGGNLTISTVAIGGTNAGDFATSNDTCTGATVAPNGTCSVSVTFKPMATGPLTGTLTFTDNSGGVARSTQTVTLSGTGTGVALASLSAPSLSFGSQSLSTTSTALTETITNTGTINLTISTATISGTNASDFVRTADTCTGATVTPNSACTVSVTFTPSAMGSRSASLNFTDNASNSPQAVTLSGTGTAPLVSLSASGLNFGNQALSTTSAALAETVTNTGTANLKISTVAIGGTNASDFAKSADTCTGATVAPGGACSISVTFTPVGHAGWGAQTGFISITDNAAGSPQSISLLGTGIDTVPPTISISANPSSLWPPNGKSVPVTVSGAITDSGSGVDPSTLACKVVDSEGSVQPACSVGSLGAGGAYSFTVSLVASRNGNDKNGRTYTISVSASDYAGNSASVSTAVIVPHDQGK